MAYALQDAQVDPSVLADYIENLSDANLDENLENLCYDCIAIAENSRIAFREERMSIEQGNLCC